MARSRVLCCVLSSFTLILLQLATADAQSPGSITIGQSLTATSNGSSSWVSPSGDFAFGFHRLDNNSDLFLLAIWYAKIPETTIVWYANEGQPVLSGSTVTLTVDKGLVLTDSQGTQVWSTTIALRISYAFLNDTGNLALVSLSNEVLWESFQHPTDTLLPTQVMNRGGLLSSRRTETSFLKGRFQFCFQPDGNLVLNTREIESNFRYDPYFASMTWDGGNRTTSGKQVVYNESGHMYILKNDGSVYNLFSNPVSPKDYYQRATMEFDGMLIWYHHPRSSHDASGWVKIAMLPSYDICPRIPRDEDSGVCGYNSICSLKSDGRPNCHCPSNYSLLDPSDTHGSCKPDFTQDDCQSNSTSKGTYTLMSLLNTDWPLDDYAQLNNSTEEECKSSCLNDCFCAAVIVDTSGSQNCWKKKFPLSHGIQNVSISRTSWLKVGDTSANSPNPFILPPKSKSKLKTVVSVLLGTSGFVNFVLISVIAYGVLIYRKKRFRRLDLGQRTTLTQYSSVSCFSYEELKEATNEFKEEIGRGAFGVVYKGTIAAGGSKMFVAVKKFHPIFHNSAKEFETEVNAIGQTHHKNLVRLIGFCKQEDDRLLVYKYMSNGSLSDYLFGDLKPDWSARIQVIHGVARGLMYLHEECSMRIIHCDIKPQNILIDEDHNACISDFGMAKLLIQNQSQTETAMRGTKGYLAPEWFSSKPVTVKVDVYSFGVLLLEIICCRKSICIDNNAANATFILTDWAFDCYHFKKLDSLVNDLEVLSDRPRFDRFVMVALWCIQNNPNLRPTMRTVVQMLEGLVQVPDPPVSSYSTTTQY